LGCYALEAKMGRGHTLSDEEAWVAAKLLADLMRCRDQEERKVAVDDADQWQIVPYVDPFCQFWSIYNWSMVASRPIVPDDSVRARQADALCCYGGE
jgi:hypothetical protein